MMDSSDDLPLDSDELSPDDTNGTPRSRTPSEEQGKMAFVNKYARLILPHIGLVALLAAYTVAGAIAFHILELPEERKTREYFQTTVLLHRNRMFEAIYNVSLDRDNLTIDDIAHASDPQLKLIIVNTYKAFTTQYISPRELWGGPAHGTHWDFLNSVFFSITVITTIGYGFWTPTTKWGRIFCIGFGLMGIPLLLVTIADIGKFLSDFLNFIYRKFRFLFKKIRNTSRRLSWRARSSLSRSVSVNSDSPDHKMLTASAIMNEVDEEEEQEQLRIPMVMVLLVLLGYTALGGLLFKYLEGWAFLDAFYFCFITMSTVGFGDMVPTKQKYMIITLCYIFLGLALTTMCIDLAGTEYINKIHMLGQKMESAKQTLSGLHMAEHLRMSAGYGFIRTAGGRLVAVRGADDLDNLDDFIFEDEKEANILYQPLSATVKRHVERANIHVLPDELTDGDIGYTVRNKAYNPKRRVCKLMVSPNQIYTTRLARPRGQTRHQTKRIERRNSVVLVVPFLWKETDC